MDPLLAHPTLALPLLGVVALAIGAPIVHAALTIRTLRGFRWLAPEARPAFAPRSVSAVLPARNEASDLRASVESLLAQRAAAPGGGVALEVIIVDDHSSDATGEIADQLAREDARVRVIHAPELPPGWLGKANAMQHGLDLATGEFILISDADIHHAPDALGTALADMERRGTDFLSFYPRIRCESLWENAVVPLLNSGLGEFPKHPALAAGAFMLVEARALRTAGGMAPIRQAPLDDVALACHLKERDHTVDFCFAPELVSVRLYKGNREAFWGITKTVLAPFGRHLWMIVPAVLLSALMYWTPAVMVVLGLLAQQPLLWLGGLAIHGLQIWSLRVSRRTVTTRPLALACFPIVVISIAACSLRALHAHLTEGAVLWRGRRLPIAEARLGAAGARELGSCS